MSRLCREATGYYSGDGVTKNLRKAFCLMTRAAETGDRDALYALGAQYDYGIATKRSRRRAFELYRKAADAGQPAAVYAVGYS